MATRRPRVKAAAILKPRRVQPSTTDQNETIIKSESSINDTKSDLSIDLRLNETASTSTPPSSPKAISTFGRLRPSDIKLSMKKIQNGSEKLNETEPSDSIDNEMKNNDFTMPFKSPIPNTEYDATTKSFRRLSTPAMVNRRKSILSTENRQIGHPSPNHLKSPSYSISNREHYIKPIASPYHGSNAPKTPNIDDEIFSPIPAEGDFKSPPFMSPSIYSRRADPSMSPFNDAYNEDYTKSPSSIANAKMRQRIRPTPCFASRRNSINCSVASDIEDDQNRRQRHYSTSSTHSNYNPAMTPQHPRCFSSLSKPHSRVRTESYSSSISDAPYIRELSSKMKRSHRSEEYQRVANAKREFNQKLNGKPPDKSRLTMYDLIYYNPMTNPMSKPAGKGDKSSDTASMSSTRTNQSRSSGSVKSEASSTTGPVKAEHTDPVTEPMPVPQLKLGANGEIVLDEKSLVIETTTDKEAREILASTEVVYDDEFSGTSGFYKRQKRTRDWLPLETIKFYRSLQTIGTDFSVMLQLFPNRSRRDLKLKFKKEEKYNMALINKALLHPKEFNVDELKLQFDKEDEEIEMKKQEWAEIRKKMNTDRKEQLMISKRRNPNKHISASMRSLTDGDMIYENEFLTLPKGRRPKRKRQLSTDALDENTTKNLINDSLLSPVPLNNNNHVDTLPTHTYATHKLPNFTEMLSTQKKIVPTQQFTSQTNLIDDQHATSPNHNQIPADDKVNIATDIRIENQSIKHRENGQLIVDNETLIERYVDKNPNLNLKSDSADIMNMDIIFENVPIEEDTSVNMERSLNNDGGTAMTPPAAVVSNDATVEKLNINGIQYEIITLDEQQQQSTSDRTNVINLENEPVNDQFVYNSNDMVIVEPSTMDIAAEVETSDGLESWNTYPTDGDGEKCVEPPSDSEQKSIKNEEEEKATIKTEQIPINPDLSKRKRKPKIIPLLNKRPRRSKLIDTTKTDQKSEIIIDEPSSVVSQTAIDNENATEENVLPKKEEEEAEEEEKCNDATATDNDGSFMNSLVVVESQDPNDLNKTLYEVFVVDPITKQMSERPLDLPDDVIQRIRMSM